MTFECMAKHGDVKCPGDIPGDVVYLGFIQLCAAHQEVFEQAATDRLLRDEVTAAAVGRGPLGHIWRNWPATPAPIGTRKVRPASTVYYMRNDGYCKIGHSVDPKHRLTCIRGNDGTLFPDDVDLPFTTIIATESGGYEREQELHRKFAHLRHTGEWFTETPELSEHIAAILATANPTQ